MSRFWNMKKLTLQVGALVLDTTGAGLTTPSLTVTNPTISSVGTVAAAGADNTDAALVPSNSIVRVTASNGTKGVILPSLAVGSTIRIKNTVASILKVYPYSGAQINALTATTGAYSQAASTFGEYVYTATNQVETLPLVIS